MYDMWVINTKNAKSCKIVTQNHANHAKSDKIVMQNHANHKILNIVIYNSRYKEFRK